MNIYAPKKPSRINSVSVSVTLFLLAFGYFLWAFVPIYWPIFQLQGIARSACNQAYKQLDDEKVIEKLVEDSRRTGLKLSEDNFQMTRIPMDDDEIEAELASFEDPRARAERALYLRQRGKACVIEYYYRDRYPLPLIGQTVELTFNNEVRGSLETVSW